MSSSSHRVLPIGRSRSHYYFPTTLVPGLLSLCFLYSSILTSSDNFNLFRLFLFSTFTVPSLYSFSYLVSFSVYNYCILYVVFSEMFFFLLFCSEAPRYSLCQFILFSSLFSISKLRLSPAFSSPKVHISHVYNGTLHPI